MCFCSYRIHIETWQLLTSKIEENQLLSSEYKLKKDSVDLLRHCFQIDERTIKDFYKARLKEKSLGLFVIITFSKKNREPKRTTTN